MPLDLAVRFPLAFIYGVVPLIDALFGVDMRNWDAADQRETMEQRAYFRTLTLPMLPLWLGTLSWSTWQFLRLPLGAFGMLGLVLSTGVISGVLAINAAHELIQKSGRLEPLGGGILLTSVGYQGFKVEHVRSYHPHVATPGKSSSARLGESAHAFVPRALWLNKRNAWPTDRTYSRLFSCTISNGIAIEWHRLKHAFWLWLPPCYTWQIRSTIY